MKSLKHNYYRVICWMTIILMIVLFCFSCVSADDEELFPATTIGFETHIGTRAQLLNDFPDGGVFGVLGYCKVNGASGEAEWLTKKVQATPNEFYNMPVSYHLTTGCDYSPKQAWSDHPNDKYTFFAYYPYNEVNVANGTGSPISLSSSSKMGTPDLTYTMPYTSSSTSQLLDMTQMQDVMVAFAFDKTQSMGMVPFTFYHILTSLRFKVNNYNSTRHIIIRNLTLKGTFHKSMSMSFDGLQGFDVEGSYRGTFNLISQSQNFPPNGTSGAQDVAMENALLLIPQSLSTSTSWIVTLTASNSEEQIEKTFTFELNNQDFASGIQYVFSFDFIGDQCMLIAQQSYQWESPLNEDNEVIFE